MVVISELWEVEMNTNGIVFVGWTDPAAALRLAPFTKWWSIAILLIS